MVRPIPSVLPTFSARGTTHWIDRLRSYRLPAVAVAFGFASLVCFGMGMNTASTAISKPVVAAPAAQVAPVAPVFQPPPVPPTPASKENPK